MRGAASSIARAALAATVLGLLAGPALAWDGPAGHRPTADRRRPFWAWPVFVAAPPRPAVVILQPPFAPPPMPAGPMVGPVPSVQDLPAVAGIARSRPAEPSFTLVGP